MPNRPFQDLPARALAEAANANLVTHVSWIQARTPGMSVHATPDLVLVDSGLPCDTFNIVCHARLDPATAADRIQAVIARFAAVARPFTWWLNPGDQPADLGTRLRAARLQEAEREQAMAADLDQLPQDSPAPGGLQVRRVRTAAQLRDFAQVVAANWTPADPLVLRFYDQAAPVLLTAEAALWPYVGYLGDVPIAAAELTVGGGVVGLYNICTLAAHRRQGFDTALTLQPLREAHTLGYRTAILQASAAGAQIYARLGFVTFGEVTEYTPLAA
jgi:hypothetical protein